MRHGVWDLVSRGIPGHRLHLSDVTFTDLCISIINGMEEQAMPDSAAPVLGVLGQLACIAEQ